MIIHYFVLVSCFLASNYIVLGQSGNDDQMKGLFSPSPSGSGLSGDEETNSERPTEHGTANSASSTKATETKEKLTPRPTTATSKPTEARLDPLPDTTAQSPITPRKGDSEDTKLVAGQSGGDHGSGSNSGGGSSQGSGNPLESGSGESSGDSKVLPRPTLGEPKEPTESDRLDEGDKDEKKTSEGSIDLPAENSKSGMSSATIIYATTITIGVFVAFVVIIGVVLHRRRGKNRVLTRFGQKQTIEAHNNAYIDTQPSPKAVGRENSLKCHSDENGCTASEGLESLP